MLSSNYIIQYPDPLVILIFPPAKTFPEHTVIITARTPAGARSRAENRRPYFNLFHCATFLNVRKTEDAAPAAC
ncbi:hypothetical protein A6M21_12640 [Desulfotomaculum copahuensis]|uniref:Uncharacterized protein n=1 Tax=Desulfotomaculum copahuensis TaxID=1838280 RepID=A0A1B7LD22_9FIRM|nr:hypothetical protein A6M21_12640 [Desulfotomaculum copahuensis]